MADHKVFHTSNDVHKLVQQYCVNNKFVIKEWVESVLINAVRDKIKFVKSTEIVKEVPTSKSARPDIKTVVDVVAKSKHVVTVKDQSQNRDDPYIKPPFWAIK